MTEFRPFEDGASSLSIDDLTIEDAGDSIAIYGSITIEATKIGLEKAEALAKVLNASVDRLRQMDLPDDLPPPNISTKPNPFD